LAARTIVIRVAWISLCTSPFSEQNLEEDIGIYAAALGNLFLQNQSKASAKHAEHKTAMLAPKVTKVSAIGGIDLDEPFEFNPDWARGEDKAWFKYQKTRHGVWTTWTEEDHPDAVNWPFRSMACMLTQYVGVSVVIVVDSASMLENGSEVVQWSSALANGELGKYPSVVLTTGSSLWLPLGTCPIIIGVSQAVLNQTETVDLKERTVGKVRHAITIGVQPLFDVDMVKAAPEPLRREMASFYVKAAPQIPPTWRTDHEGHAAWKKAIDGTE